ncbi:tropinesterase [Variibacter gotjawalensis]|uniref:Tropinesterase n=1 Tax=Variibacter gotjawalensis TaxID=1333996 RepID=A0A0S3Q0X2_9BRAD|nr:alpha/beta fold hydrolase [Variibacter gotjawalensis]NIK47649.1 pimeloyl-ACP methyl ester carboxylesterase [Variibacter gotjawalensis]RZS49546.1 pimeloyl-ACP methyl ester carboxylesterase [Variibacter gotjawalensis]BAT61809.1 tropinesterase [Variibacter gotjawalensis]
MHFVSRRKLYVEHGGADGDALILLHGMGANAAAWHRFLPLVEKNWQGRWFAPDLRGHGRSLREGPYGIATLAADVAELMAEIGAPNATILGHSYGGAIAALVGTGWYGVNPARIVSVGAKLVWSAEEIAQSHAIAAKPARGFATRAEAVERALKVAGMFGQCDPESPEALAGVREENGQWWTAFDARALAGAGPDIEQLFHLCSAPKRLAAGESDPMMFFDAMQRVDPHAEKIANAGHNAQWEQPEAVWRFFVGG